MNFDIGFGNICCRVNPPFDKPTFPDARADAHPRPALGEAATVVAGRRSASGRAATRDPRRAAEAVMSFYSGSTYLTGLTL